MNNSKLRSEFVLICIFIADFFLYYSSLINASLNIHSAIPDGFLKVFDQTLVVGANEVKDLQTSIPICESESGPTCHHISYSATFGLTDNSYADLLNYYILSDFDQSKSKSDNFFHSTTHRHPININKQYQLSQYSITLNFPSYYKSDRYLNITHNLGLYSSSIPRNTFKYRGIPVHSEDNPYLPEGLLLEEGIGDIYINENLVQTLLQSYEYFTNKISYQIFNNLWSFNERSHVLDSNLPTDDPNQNSSKLLNLAYKSNKKKYHLQIEYINWRGVSHLLDFSSTLQILGENHVPLYFRGNLPPNLQTKWIGFWKIRQLFPSITWKAKSYEQFNEIFQDLQGNQTKTFPFQRKKDLLTEIFKLYFPPSLNVFAILNSPKGQIEFFSAVVVSSLWVTIDLSSDHKKNLENTNTKGMRIIGLKCSVIRWIVDFPYTLIENFLSKHYHFQPLFSKRTLIFDVMRLAKYSSFHRIDTIKFEYSFRDSSSLIKRLDIPLALGAIILNTPHRTSVYEPIFTIESSKYDNFPVDQLKMFNQIYMNQRDNNNAEDFFFPIFSPSVIDSNVASFDSFIHRSIKEDELLELLKRETEELLEYSFQNKPDQNPSVKNLINSEQNFEAPLIPLLYIRSFDFDNLIFFPHIDEFLKLREQRNKLYSFYFKKRVRKFQSLSTSDSRPQLKRMSIILQNLPIESPVISINDMSHMEAHFYLKPTSKTESVLLNIKDEDNYLLRKLRATKDSDDFLKDGEELMKNLFENYHNFSSLFEEIESFHVISKGRIHKFDRHSMKSESDLNLNDIPTKSRYSHSQNNESEWNAEKESENQSIQSSLKTIPPKKYESKKKLDDSEIILQLEADNKHDTSKSNNKKDQNSKIDNNLSSKSNKKIHFDTVNSQPNFENKNSISKSKDHSEKESHTKGKRNESLIYKDSPEDSQHQDKRFKESYKKRTEQSTSKEVEPDDNLDSLRALTDEALEEAFKFLHKHIEASNSDSIYYDDRAASKSFKQGIHETHSDPDQSLDHNEDETNE